MESRSASVTLVLLLLWNTVLADESSDTGASFDYYTCCGRLSGNEAELSYRCRLTVHNARGEEHASLTFSESQLRSLDNVEVRLIDASGAVLAEQGKGDLYRICGFGASYVIFSDICYYTFTPTSPTYPYSLEYSFDQKLSSLMLFRGFALPDDLPIDSVYLQITAPSDLPIHCKQYGVVLNRDDKSAGDSQIITWSTNGYSPADKDTLSLIDKVNAGKVSIVPDRFEFASIPFEGVSWDNIGSWCHRLVSERLDRPNAVAAPVSCEEAREIMDSTYSAVVSNYRYVAISIGVSGWQPRSAKKTRETGYGDCKGLSTLLISDLLAQGIEAYPVLILTRNESYVDPAFPAFDFNHMIVAAICGEDTVWMDPTCRCCSFGDLPRTDEDVYVLLATPQGGTLVKTPGSSPEDNGVVKKATILLDGDLNLRINGSVRYTGNYAHWFQSLVDSYSREQLCRYAERLLAVPRTPMIVSEARFDSLTADGGVGLSFQAHSKKPLRPIGGTIYVPFSPFESDSRYTTKDVDDLKRPLLTGYPRKRCDSVVLILDDSFSASGVDLPESASSSQRFASFNCEAIAAADTIRAVSTVSFNVYEVPPEEFETLIEYEIQVDQALNQHIKIQLDSK